jgi:iron complex transport system ATP-binding protein
MSLLAENVSYAYPGGTQAARSVTLEVKRGELLGIIGPNGSGKSTLLRLLGGLLKPGSGRIVLDGLSIARLRRNALARRVAFLPQRVETTFAFTAEEIVAQGRHPHLSALGFLSRDDLRAIAARMTETDTLALARRPFDDLSGGERQRVLIASVLAQEADHLLLDEPTSALDIQHQAEVFTLLRNSARAGIAVAVVVHDLNLAAQFCDRLVLMSVGQLVGDGPPAETLRFDTLAPVYGGNVTVSTNPVTGGPLVVVLAPHPGDRATPEGETPCPC